MDNLTIWLSYLHHPEWLNTAIQLLSNPIQLLSNPLTTENWPVFSATTLTSFTLIAAAEIGDKSQLVCMTLAAKHRPLPVLFGAITAFALLNSLAVIFGLTIASWLPEYWVAAIVAGLFAIFGIHALRSEAEAEDENMPAKSGHSIFLSTFFLITVAEFGDKTQLAVVALSSTAIPLAVWLGSTLALSGTSAMGIIAGRTVLKNMPLALLHKLSGALFLSLACLAAYRAYSSYINLVG